MSFTKEKRQQIKRYILEKIDAGDPDIAKCTAETFGISLNTTYRYIKELQNDNYIKKGNGTFSFVETSENIILKRSQNELIYEDFVYDKYIAKHMQKFPDNVKQIWEYSFMEMMNNAIDHSNAETVTISICANCLYTAIMIYDNGIGIFRKIQEYYHYASLDDAVNQLFKGKLTTDSENHSGEGIFFTSRILDRFAAISDGKVFTHDKYFDMLQNLKDISFVASKKDCPGTTIYMELSNDSNKILKEVFDMFSDQDGGFTRTQIPIKNIYETYPVSRSQAKRLCYGFDKFQEVVLDFVGVKEIGQGFAHEIFVVYQKKHPEIRIIAQNTSSDVQKMINHVVS